MHARLLATVLLTAGAWLPAVSHAAGEYSPQWWIYSVNQVCQVWADGIARCFPVATLGPAPKLPPGGLEPITQPAAPPSLAAAPAQQAPAAVPPPAEDRPAAEPEARDMLAHFEFDSAALTDAGRAALDGWLRSAPGDGRIRLTGHADRLGPANYNHDLSRRRADTVAQYLAGKGIRQDRIQIEAAGESLPVTRCKGGSTPATKACLAPNRRVEIKTE